MVKMTSLINRSWRMSVVGIALAELFIHFTMSCALAAMTLILMPQIRIPHLLGTAINGRLHGSDNLKVAKANEVRITIVLRGGP